MKTNQKSYNQFKSIVLLFAISGMFFFSCEKETKESSPINILLVGSSFSSGVSNYLDNLVFSTGDTINRFTSAIGGGTLKDHCQYRVTMSRLIDREWDFILLQESSYFAAVHPDKTDRYTAKYLEVLLDTIKTCSPDTRVGLYMTQAYRNGDSDHCNTDTVVCSFEGMQDRIIRNNQYLAEKYSLELAPLGYLWKKFREEHDDIEVYIYDHTHATHAGNYLVACTIYKTIYKKSPVGIPVWDKVEEETGRLIQQFVEEHYQEGLTNL